MSNMPPPYPGQEPYQGQGQQYPPPAQPVTGAYGQPGAPQQPYGAGVPNHPQATTVLVLGIASFFVTLMCCLPLGIAPWIMGSSAIKQVDANPGQYDGRGQLQAGKIMGIVSLILWALMLVGTIALFAWMINSPEFQEEWDAALQPATNIVATVSA